jgi:hypothetical protein
MNGKPIHGGLVSEEESYIAIITDTTALPTVKFVPPSIEMGLTLGIGAN